MPILIGNREDVVASLSGHTVGFKAGEETFVPDIPTLIKACVERGHVVKKDSAPAAKAEPAPAEPAEPATARKPVATKPAASK